MTRILARWAITAAAIAFAAWLFDGIWFRGPTHGTAELQHKIIPLLIVAAIATVVTAWVKPVLTVLSIPLILLTLGIFLLILNALMLKFVAWLSGLVDLGFHVNGFWTAVWGSVVISIVTWILDALVGPDE